MPSALREAADLRGDGVVGVAEVVVDVPLHQRARPSRARRRGRPSSAACTSPTRAAWCRRAAARTRGSRGGRGRGPRRRRSSPTGCSARGRSRPSPIEWKPAASATAGSDHCGRRSSVLATRSSANACCSGVTPSMPDRSTGFGGSNAAGRRRRRRPVVVGALVGAGAVAGGLPGAVALEGGERAALVGGDPHVDHRVAAAGVDGARGAVAGGVGDAGDDRLAVRRRASSTGSRGRATASAGRRSRRARDRRWPCPWR